MLRSLLSFVFVLSIAAAVGQSSIPAKDAAKHIGEKVTICDKVYGGRYFENGKDQPTLLNMGDAFPNNPFTFVVYGEDRKKFSWKPEEYLVDKEVCVTGEVKDYRGKPQIVVSDTAQVVIKK
jgi:micrococcal nuclease